MSAATATATKIGPGQASVAASAKSIGSASQILLSILPRSRTAFLNTIAEPKLIAPLSLILILR